MFGRAKRLLRSNNHPIVVMYPGVQYPGVYQEGYATKLEIFQKTGEQKSSILWCCAMVTSSLLDIIT